MPNTTAARVMAEGGVAARRVVRVMPNTTAARVMAEDGVASRHGESVMPNTTAARVMAEDSAEYIRGAGHGRMATTNRRGERRSPCVHNRTRRDV